MFSTGFFKAAILTAVAASAVAAQGVAKSPKRGVCWDSHYVNLNSHHANQLSEGVSWVYNWGPDATEDVYSSDFCFVPMAWNGSFNEQRIRTWIQAHPETQYLLGFNEPNFADQAAMTPEAAASIWPRLKKIAEDFDLTLVAPALNFSASKVGGKVWSIYEWYDEFFRLCPDSGIDCLALHCYMNWFSSNTWFATEYIYSDLYKDNNNTRYPNLTAFVENYKSANGHFPRMMLTEFCSWENDGTIKGVDFQIDQMTQKVQKLELSDLVEGYAWFMANDNNGASAYPYMSLFERNKADSELSTLGKVYVNMSAFDCSRYYQPGETVDAKDYVEATTDNSQIRLRPNTEIGSEFPLQVEIPASGYPDYLIEVPSDAGYSFAFHVSTSAATKLWLYVDAKKTAEVAIPSTDGKWTDVNLDTVLASGQHRIMLYNAGSEPILINSFRFENSSSVPSIADDAKGNTPGTIYSLNGICMPEDDLSKLPAGVYIETHPDGGYEKFVIK